MGITKLFIMLGFTTKLFIILLFTIRLFITRLVTIKLFTTRVFTTKLFIIPLFTIRLFIIPLFTIRLFTTHLLKYLNKVMNLLKMWLISQSGTQIFQHWSRLSQILVYLRLSKALKQSQFWLPL